MGHPLKGSFLNFGETVLLFIDTKIFFPPEYSICKRVTINNIKMSSLILVFPILFDQVDGFYFPYLFKEKATFSHGTLSI